MLLALGGQAELLGSPGEERQGAQRILMSLSHCVYVCYQAAPPSGSITCGEPL